MWSVLQRVQAWVAGRTQGNAVADVYEDNSDEAGTCRQQQAVAWLQRAAAHNRRGQQGLQQQGLRRLICGAWWHKAAGGWETTAVFGLCICALLQQHVSGAASEA